MPLITAEPTQSPAATQTPLPPQRAGFWMRVVACVVDGAIVLLCGSIAGILVMVPAALFLFPFRTSIGLLPRDEVAQQIFSLGFMIFAWLYYAGMEASRWQATPGKMLLQLRVVGVDGTRLSLGRATGRFFGKVLSIVTFYVGFLMVAFTSQKQGLHDILAGCLVVKRMDVATQAVEPTRTLSGAGARPRAFTNKEGRRDMKSTISLVFVAFATGVLCGVAYVVSSRGQAVDEVMPRPATVDRTPESTPPGSAMRSGLESTPSTVQHDSRQPTAAVKELVDLLGDTGGPGGTNLRVFLDEVGHWGKIGQAANAITDKKEQRDAVIRTMAFVRSREHDENAAIFCKRGIWALTYFPHLAAEFTPLLHDLEASNNDDIAEFAQKQLRNLRNNVRVHDDTFYP